jgi:hypothetical protein
LSELFPLIYSGEGMLPEKITVEDYVADFVSERKSVSPKATFLYKSIYADGSQVAGDKTITFDSPV